MSIQGGQAQSRSQAPIGTTWEDVDDDAYDDDAGGRWGDEGANDRPWH
jgi:hypothetical protein